MKTKQEQIEEMAVIWCVRNPQAHTAEECAKCDVKQGQCNAYRHAEALYSVVISREEYETLANRYKNLEITSRHLCDNYRLCKDANETLKQNVIAARKETAEKIFGDLWNNFVEYSSYAMDYTQHLGEYDHNINITVSDVIDDIICIAKKHGVDLEVEE